MTGFSTITTKGQVTIPVDMRRYLEMKPGDRVYMEINHPEKTVQIKKAKKNTVDELYGSLHTDLPYIPIEKAREIAAQEIAKHYGLDR